MSVGRRRPHLKHEADAIIASGRSPWLRPAWLPIPLLAGAIVALWAADLRISYESPALLIGLNFVFLALMPVLIVYLIGRSFLATGAPGLLMMGCGIIFWGASGFVGSAAGQLGDSGRDFANITVTIHNISVWLSGACLLAGMGLSLRQRRAVRAARPWLTAAYAAALLLVGLVTISAIADRLPTFFVQGQGGTLLRQFVLGSAIGMFALTAALLGSANHRFPSSFTHWYRLALALIAVGLFGVMMEPSHGSPLSWAGRAAQFLGGVYMLIAAVASVRESQTWEIPLEEVLHREPAFVSEVLKTVGALVVVMERQGRIVSFNRACEAATGYSVEEVKGKHVWDFLLVPDEVEPAKAVFEQLQTAQFPNENENYWVAKDGTRRLIHWTNSCLKNSSGAVEYVIGTGIEVTERRRAEEALLASEARFRAMVQNSSDTIVLFDGEGTILYQSPSIERLLGYRPEERIGRNLFHNSIVHPADQAAKRAFFEAARRHHRTPVTAEFRLRHADGSWRDIEAVGQSFLHDPGIAAVVANYRDVTDRKQAEEALRQQAQLLHLSYDAIIVWRKDGAIEQWNRGAEQLYGFTESEALGRVTHKLLKTIHPVPWPEIEAAMRKHGQWEGELRHCAKDGHEVTVSARHQLVLGTDEIERILETNRDVTDRKQAEEALRESEEKYRKIVETATEAIIIVDAEARIVFINDRWSEILGYSREEALHMTHFDLLFPEDVAAMKERWKSRKKGRKEIYELRVRRKDGSPVWVLVGVAPNFGPEGEFLGTLTMLADITERKVAEEALTAAKTAAEAATQAKSRFLANMSHELRTPMNAILGMIDVALPKTKDPTVRDCLQTAKGSADLLLSLLNDLLDSAKIESGKLELEAAPFSLRRLLDQIASVLSVRANEKGLGFGYRVADQTPDAVIGDRMRLQQILLNLAGNAIKFTERGDVEVIVRNLPHESEACLEFAVRDTGIGIPSSAQECLFQPFNQADVSMARRFGGTGLGLSISKSLVEMMGGRIWVESEVGKGSTFYFIVRLTLAKEPLPEFEPSAVPPATALRQLRVLLVEDNPANQKVATYILHDRGHVVEVAGDGLEALSLTEQNRYDVILMDVEMPGMDGLEATAAIRKRDSGSSRVPIIAMTAHAMESDRQRCLAAGMDGYLSKPVNAQEMIGLVESLARDTSPALHISSEAPKTSGAVAPFDPAIFDPDTALSRCANSTKLLRDMIKYFFGEVENLFPQMREALAAGDLVETGRLGHRMLGTVVFLAAHQAKQAALAVERFAKGGGTPAEAGQAVEALERECLVLKGVLTEQSLENKLAGDESN